jgi:hypothetical protein
LKYAQFALLLAFCFAFICCSHAPVEDQATKTETVRKVATDDQDQQQERQVQFPSQGVRTIIRRAAKCFAKTKSVSSTPSNYYGLYPEREKIENWIGLVPATEQTPGAINPCVKAKTICAPKFTTKPYRGSPPSKKVMAAYNQAYPGYEKAVLNDKELPGRTVNKKTEGRKEIDHVISLEMGGADDILNLWPQPFQSVTAGAHDKDRIENMTKEELCEIYERNPEEGEEFLALMQRAISGGHDPEGNVPETTVTWYDIFVEAVRPHLDECGNLKKDEEIRFQPVLLKYKEILKDKVLQAIPKKAFKSQDCGPALIAYPIEMHQAK